MKQAGQIVVTPFPYTDLSGQKLRPVLLLRLESVGLRSSKAKIGPSEDSF